MVDFTVYNPMVRRFAWMRLTTEMTKAGGVIPESDLETVALFQDGTVEDVIYNILQAVVACFYVYFAVLEACEMRMKGLMAYFGEWLNWCQCLNIVLFVVQLVCRWTATNFVLLPDGRRGKSALEGTHIDHSVFLDMWPAVRMHQFAMAAQATNVFLNWFKLISYLSFVPNFATMSNTLSRSAQELSAFGLVFFVVMYGFAQAHAMVFQHRIFNFRTVGQTVFTLTRSLLGDFDFQEMQDGHSSMGPALFILFVVLANFVVLNIIIAIIMSTYDHCKEEEKFLPSPRLFRDLRRVLWESIISAPIVGQMVRTAFTEVGKTASKLQSQLLQQSPGLWDKVRAVKKVSLASHHAHEVNRSPSHNLTQACPKSKPSPFSELHRGKNTAGNNDDDTRQAASFEALSCEVSEMKSQLEDLVRLMKEVSKRKNRLQTGQPNMQYAVQTTTTLRPIRMPQPSNSSLELPNGNANDYGYGD